MVRAIRIVKVVSMIRVGICRAARAAKNTLQACTMAMVTKKELSELIVLKRGLTIILATSAGTRDMFTKLFAFSQEFEFQCSVIVFWKANRPSILSLMESSFVHSQTGARLE